MNKQSLPLQVGYKFVPDEVLSLYQFMDVAFVPIGAKQQVIQLKLNDARKAMSAPAQSIEPLTVAQIESIMSDVYTEGNHGRNLEIAFARAIEAAHGIKEAA